MYKFIIFYDCQSIFLHLGDKATVREPNETASEEEIQEEGEVIAGHYCHLQKECGRACSLFSYLYCLKIVAFPNWQWDHKGFKTPSFLILIHDSLVVHFRPRILTQIWLLGSGGVSWHILLVNFAIIDKDVNMWQLLAIVFTRSSCWRWHQTLTDSLPWSRRLWCCWWWLITKIWKYKIHAWHALNPKTVTLWTIVKRKARQSKGPNTPVAWKTLGKTSIEKGNAQISNPPSHGLSKPLDFK